MDQPDRPFPNEFFMVALVAIYLDFVIELPLSLPS